MAQTALEKIAAIEADAKAKIDALKAEAVSELAKKLAEAKAVVAALTAEYEELTGKKLSGEKAAGKRVRLSAEEKEALKVTVAGIIKGAKDGAKFGDIVSQAGASDSAVRDALKGIKGIKTTGSRATTLYFLK